jgi:hypothetical protein
MSEEMTFATVATPDLRPISNILLCIVDAAQEGSQVPRQVIADSLDDLWVRLSELMNKADKEHFRQTLLNS